MRTPEPLEELFFRYLHRAEGGRGIGFSSNLRIRCFLDLLSAAHHPGPLGLMVSNMVELLEREDAASGVGIMAPKWGNVLMARAIAEKLECPSAYFKADPLFGQWLEGPVAKDREWLLIDDVGSDGERLEDLVSRVRQLGIKMRRAFFLVERLEGDVRESLQTVGVTTFAVAAVDDRELEGLQVRRRSLLGENDGKPAEDVRRMAIALTEEAAARRDDEMRSRPPEPSESH